MEFKSNGLEIVLFPQNENPYTGREKKVKLSNNILLFYDKFGSFRFIKVENNKSISGIQIMQTSDKKLITANIFTLEDHRRKGIAKELFHTAKDYFKSNISHSQNLSYLGKIFTEKVN